MADLTNEQLDAIINSGSQTLASTETRRNLMRAAIAADRALTPTGDAAEALTALDELRSSLHDGSPNQIAIIRKFIEGRAPTLPAKDRASLRHFLSAALIFGKGSVHTRTLEAFDEWFSMMDSQTGAGWPFKADATMPGIGGSALPDVTQP